MNCKRQSHFARNCRTQGPGTVTNQLRETQKPQNTEELKETRGCILKHFAFCYDNRCPVHEETKYNASYWPQEPELKQLRNIKETDRL